MVRRKPVPGDATRASPGPGSNTAEPERYTGAQEDEDVWARVEPEETAEENPGRSGRSGGGSTVVMAEEANAWVVDEADAEPPGTVEAADRRMTDKQQQQRQQQQTIMQERPSQETRRNSNPFKKQPVQSSEESSRNTSNISDGTPAAAFERLHVNEPSNNPWQPAVDAAKQNEVVKQQVVLPPHLTPMRQPEQELETDPWATTGLSRSGSSAAIGDTKSTSIPTLQSHDSSTWDDVSAKSAQHIGGPSLLDETTTMEDDAHAWDDLGDQSRGKAPARVGLSSDVLPDGTLIDEWHVVEPGQENTKGKGPSRGDDEESASVPGEGTQSTDPMAQARPSLPPRPSGEPKTETYQVKNIRWHDVKAKSNPRLTPILVQNANGPCPLVALVNALTMTTPAQLTDTVLIETLRSREQVSLDLLLRAVFEELMSGRRLGPNEDYPDIIELHTFLLGLHTGMNVNPRFIPTPEIVQAFKKTTLTHIHPTNRGEMVPGTFEDTKEMAFYRIFSIPLIHGWIPDKTDAVYDAMSRQAQSYEDAQNLLFREEELEDRLSNPRSTGLSGDEQTLYQDILTIKSFLAISATQLTTWGLEVITKAMPPGSIAILFRNDHFSTLYKHPKTLALFSLVTDAGYATHDEIVWETLLDVNGERSEYLSGDFRVVGGAGAQVSESGRETAESSNTGGGGGGSGGGDWTTVQGRRGQNNNTRAPPEVARGDQPSEAPLSAEEQVDHDLALAMQLQEEEDERHRTEQAQRRREAQLSEQFIEQQGRPSGGPNSQSRTNNNGRRPQGESLIAGRRTSSYSTSTSIPVTGTGSGTGSGRRTAPSQQVIRPLIPPAANSGLSTTATDTGYNRRTNRPNASNEEAPPTYEQASVSPLYLPPQGHPAHPTSPNASSGNVSAISGGGGGGGGGGAGGSQQQSGPGGRRPSYRQGGGLGGGGGPTSPGVGPGSVGGSNGGFPGANGNAGARDRGERECVVM